VWVFYDALSGSPSNSDLITGSDVQAGFGASIAAGDLNSDGADDLLIGESAPTSPVPPRSTSSWVATASAL
jgi:hypothetical protein